MCSVWGGGRSRHKVGMHGFANFEKSFTPSLIAVKEHIKSIADTAGKKAGCILELGIN